MFSRGKNIYYPQCHKLLVGFVSALVMFGIVVWFNWRHTARMQETAELVAHTHEVQANLNRLLALLDELDDDARDFVGTGDPASLTSFTKELKAVTGQQRKLARLNLDAEERAALSDLEPLIAECMAAAQRSVDLRQNSGFEAARREVTSGRSGELLNQLRTSFAHLELKDQALLESRASDARTEAKKANMLTLTGTGMSFALFICVFALVLRENRLRRESGDALNAVNRELESALQENRLIMEHSPDVICTINEQGEYIFVSAACQKMWGYKPDDLVGRNYMDLVHLPDREKTGEALADIMTGGALRDFENRYHRQDGSLVPVAWSTSWWADEKLMFCVARDISAQKEAEDSIRQLNADLSERAAQLGEANKELEAFSYSVSHDLRAPLRHVHGYVEMLERATEGQLSDKAQRYLRTIKGASVEMAQLIDDLLAFSRMGRAEMIESHVPLEALLRDTMKGLELANQGRNIVWKVAPLPQVVGDPSMLKQVLANLVGNAVKYTGKCDPAEIEVGYAGEEEDRAIFFVRDNGAGFDMQYAHKLFGVFQRLHRAEEFEGTGIGLATVRRIIARHGGRVWADAKVGEGATFHFTLRPAARS
jgi:PAS domain S-box-containing protein